MGDVSTHFSRKEFACKCGCGFDVVDAELLAALEGARQYFDNFVRILSGCRCLSRNLEVGGSLKSQHMLGKAADVAISGVSPLEVAEYFEKLYKGRYGIGRYATFTHIDVRSSPARWDRVAHDA
jgi:uncharacterized protein YcbK (DUF882 family)